MSADLGKARPLVWSEPGRTTQEIKTGGWRTRRPRYVERPAPCHVACPAGEAIPAWIARAAVGDYGGAWEQIRQENPFPAIMGRICAHPCEAACNRGQYDDAVAVNALERFVGDWGLRHRAPEPPCARPAPSVAVVGGGPAGLACAYHLARLGHGVALYEAMPELGGLLRYGIPEYRLPRDVLDAEIAMVLGLGITVHTGVRVGETIPWEGLGSYRAVFVATGAACPVKLGIAEETSPGVYDGLAFLRAVNSGARPSLGEQVVVVGGGSTATDVARTARRLGAAVTVVALEAREAMPALAEEVAQALMEGVGILNEVGVEEMVVSDRGLAGIRVRRARLSVTESGAIRPVFGEGGTETLAADALLLALGQLPDPACLPPDLRVERGLVTVGEDGATAELGFYAGGDLTLWTRSVAHAMGSGTRAARAIHRALTGMESRPARPHPGASRSDQVVGFADINGDAFPRLARAERHQREAADRIASFVEAVAGLDETQARPEARRCFSCGACTRCDVCLIFCPDVAIRRLDSEGYEVLEAYCKGCGLCARECPRGALVMVPER
ncbi:MAG: FAD-dependent oxidoreductase [Candidatus Rokubacteria bacterium]|nr:FAD-dependent oxidoreductase [Candidatus Rokubacteria bacterium]